MSCGCNATVYEDDSIAGMDETDMLLMGGAVGGYIATAYLDNMLVYDKSGHKKTGTIAENDAMRNGSFVAGGIALNWLIPDEPIVKGSAIGMAVYGVKELIRGQYPTIGIKGTRANGDEKYIASARTMGEDKYIGRAQTRKINLLNNKNPQSREQVSIKNERA